VVILEAERVWKTLGGRFVLRGASLRVNEGERVVIIGENGSGKSTLLHVLTGVLDADDGEVLANGAIGFAPEKPDLPDHLRVVEWLDVVASLKGAPRVTAPLGFGVEDLERRPLAALSLGQRQRVALATAWLGDPNIIVLDEPTNGLDADTRAEVLERLSSSRTSLVATHDPDVVERIATKVVTLRQGRIA
jgi:ABC-2 type transport system ATP-binding protein